jgi:cytochrome P450
MATVAELELPAFNYLDPELRGERFHEALRELSDRTWVARAEPIGFFVLDREAAAHFLRSDQAVFPGMKLLEVQGITSGPLYERARGNLLNRSGEDHRRLRKLVQPSFTPPAADRHRPAMREQLELLWSALDGATAFDFVEAIAKPYPGRMIALLMGSPLDDAPRLAHWANLIQGRFDPTRVAAQMADLDRASIEFEQYMRALVESRRGDPRNDLISELIAAEEEGDRLSDADCLSLIGAVLVGGVDTTQAQLTHAIRLFAAYPEQWSALAEDPSLAAAAVEEVLRFEPITPFTARIALEDLEYRDVRFPKDTLIFAISAAANRDPQAYAAPDDFDIRADRGRAKVLSFGAGPHFCLGANLARAELGEALAFLAPRMPGLELDGDPVYESPLGVYGIESLPVRFAA